MSNINENQMITFEKIKSSFANSELSNNKIRFEYFPGMENPILFVFVECMYACKILWSGEIQYPDSIFFPKVEEILNTIKKRDLNGRA